jgi:hypothetical protein
VRKIQNFACVVIVVIYHNARHFVSFCSVSFVIDRVLPVVSNMETATFIQLSTLPDYIKKGSLYQELQKSQFQSTGDDGSDGSFAGDDNTISTATGVEEPYLSFPAQYCRFDVAAALASTSSPLSKAAAAVEAAVEPGSTAAAHTVAAAAAAANTAAGAFSAQVLPASVLGAAGVMSTLRYWGVEDELPLELVRYLLESEELSPPSSPSSMALASVDRSIDAGATNTAGGETVCIVHVQGTTTTTSAAAASAPPPPPCPFVARSNCLFGGGASGGRHVWVSARLAAVARYVCSAASGVRSWQRVPAAVAGRA